MDRADSLDKAGAREDGAALEAVGRVTEPTWLEGRERLERGPKVAGDLKCLVCLTGDWPCARSHS